MHKVPQLPGWWLAAAARFDSWCCSHSQPNTLRTYRAILSSFARWCFSRPRTPSEHLEMEDVRGYLRHLSASQKARVTVRLHRSVLRAFARVVIPELLLQDWGVVPRQHRRVRSGLSVEQIRRILECPPLTTLPPKQRVIWHRNRAFWELLYGSGLRVHEACALVWNDLDVPGRTARVLGKGNKYRWVPLGDYFLQALWEYRQFVYGDREPSGSWPVFGRANRPDCGLTPRTMQYHLRRWLQQLGLPWEITTHQFRHSCATHMLEHGAGLRQVQQLLGHARLDTTQLYVGLSPEHLRQVYEAAHPMGNCGKLSGEPG